MNEDPSVTPFDPTSSDTSGSGDSGVGVALLAEGEDTPFGCAINTLDTEAPDGYSTWRMALSFPESAVEEADGETVPFRFAIRAETDDGSEGPLVTRVRCQVPRSEEAVQRMAQRIEEGLERRFDRDYDLGGAGDESALRFHTMQEECVSPSQDCWDEGVVVTAPAPENDPPPLPPNDIPPAPDPDTPGDNEDGNGGGSTPPPGTENCQRAGMNRYLDPDHPDDPTPYRVPEADEGCEGGNPSPPSYAPEGVDEDLYDSMNEKEKELCWQSPGQCWRVGSYAQWALEWANQTGLEGAGNGPQDAVRHAAWSATITLAFGAKDAEKWTDAHEWDSASEDQTVMDQHNNAVGRRIGSRVEYRSEIEDEVMEAYENGDLCTGLSDC